MGMKTNKKDSNTSASFPKLMEHTKTGMVILAIEESYYVTLHVGCDKYSYIGEYFYNHSIDEFVDFDGTLELKND